MSLLPDSLAGMTVPGAQLSGQGDKPYDCFRIFSQVKDMWPVSEGKMGVDSMVNDSLVDDVVWGLRPYATEVVSIERLLV